MKPFLTTAILLALVAGTAEAQLSTATDAATSTTGEVALDPASRLDPVMAPTGRLSRIEQMRLDRERREARRQARRAARAEAEAAQRPAAAVNTRMDASADMMADTASGSMAAAKTDAETAVRIAAPEAQATASGSASGAAEAGATAPAPIEVSQLAAPDAGLSTGTDAALGTGADVSGGMETALTGETGAALAVAGQVEANAETVVRETTETIAEASPVVAARVEMPAARRSGAAPAPVFVSHNDTHVHTRHRRVYSDRRSGTAMPAPQIPPAAPAGRPAGAVPVQTVSDADTRVSAGLGWADWSVLLISLGLVLSALSLALRLQSKRRDTA